MLYVVLPKNKVVPRIHIPPGDSCLHHRSQPAFGAQEWRKSAHFSALVIFLWDDLHSNFDNFVGKFQPLDIQTHPKEVLWTPKSYLKTPKPEEILLME